MTTSREADTGLTPFTKRMIAIFLAFCVLSLLATALLVVALDYRLTTSEPEESSSWAKLRAARRDLTVTLIDTILSTVSSKEQFRAMRGLPPGPPVPTWALEDHTDAWGTPFHLAAPGHHGQPWEVVSYGADGKPGGTGWDTDLRAGPLAGPGGIESLRESTGALRKLTPNP